KAIVVTGLGAVSPLGPDWRKTWAGLLEGRSGIGPLTAFDAASFKTRIAGQVLEFTPPATRDPKTVDRMERFAQFALAAAREAILDSGLEAKRVDPRRVGVVIGTGIGGLVEAERSCQVLAQHGPRRLNPLGVLRLIGNTASAAIGMEYGFQGPSYCPTSACASGGHALAAALDLLRAGRADIVVAGGAEACISPLTIGNFGAMHALSQRNEEPQRASRPFDEARDGFVLAEGSAVVVLERLEAARQRRAPIRAVFRGAGLSTDAYHLTAPHPEGLGYRQAMSLALEDGGLPLDAVGYLNAHATATRLCDELEARAIRTLFENAPQLRVSSTKSMTGHLLGAAGALEFCVAVQALQERLCPPTINLEQPTPEAQGLDLVPNAAREMAPGSAVLSNSFGFGGHNVCLALSGLD
ncbi:MAG: beta-ketoacyl-ACP synthase II, partial [Chloroflexota bacterium]